MSSHNENSHWANEIPVDFEDSWYMSVIEARQATDTLDEEETVESRRQAHVEMRTVQYMLGAHLRTREVRVITNRPVRREPIESHLFVAGGLAELVELDDPCEICGLQEVTCLNVNTGHMCCTECSDNIEAMTR